MTDSDRRAAGDRSDPPDAPADPARDTPEHGARDGAADSANAETPAPPDAPGRSAERQNGASRPDDEVGTGAGNADATGTAPAAGGAPPRKPRFSINTFRSLSDPNYRWYFLSMLGWFAGMNLQMFARGYLVFELTGSYAALGFVSLSQAIPGLIFSFTGGVLADRVRSKKRLVQVFTAINALGVLAIGVLITLDLIAVWHLYVSAALQGTIMSNMMPSRQVLTSEVVGLERLMNALALNNAGMNFNRLAMPALGGGLVSFVGTGTGLDGADIVYYVMAALFALSVVALWPVRAPERDISKRGRTSVAVVAGELVDGLRYMRHDATVRMLLLINFLLVIGTMPYQQMLPGFAREVLGAEAGGLGFLMSVQGVGALGGALVLASLPNRHRGMILLCASGLLGITLLLFAWSTWFWVTAGILVVVGIGQSGRMALSQVLVQTYTEPEYRGRVMSIHMMEISLMQFAVFLVGILANIVGPQIAVGSTAVFTLLVVIFGFGFLPRLRHLQ